MNMVLSLLAGVLLMAHPAFAKKEVVCEAWGRSFASGERDCNGRLCQKGKWQGKASKKQCQYEDAEEEEGEAAQGCHAYGRDFAVGEEDCNGRVCAGEGAWHGVSGKVFCMYDSDGNEVPSGPGEK